MLIWFEFLNLYYQM